MPRFYFDFHGGGEGGLDNEGVEFESFELAYLDAYQSMIRMGAEQLLEQRDPSRQWINIRDSSRQLLLKLCFDEVFRQRSERPPTPSRQSTQYMRLSEEIARAHVNAKRSVADARETIARAEATRVALHLGW